MGNHLRFNQRIVLPIALGVMLLAAAMPASAHLFNHQDRHEVCDIYGAPHGHGDADGHRHWHHLTPAAEAHAHGGVLYPAGHTHADVFHDPCDQAGILTVPFTPADPFVAPALPEVVIGPAKPGVTGMILRDAFEVVGLPVASLTPRDDIVIRSDADLAQFPGKGTQTDPYVIAGYHVRNILLIKDTSKCVVVRDNVIYNDARAGPIVDPKDIVDVRDIVDAAAKQLERTLADLAPVQEQLDAAQAVLDALVSERDEREAQQAQLAAAWQALLDAVATNAAAERALRADAEATMDAIRGASAELRSALASQNVTLPAEPVVSGVGDPRFATFVAEVEAIAEAADQDAQIVALRERIATLRASYEDQGGALAAASVVLAQNEAARDTFRPVVDDARAEHDAWLAQAWTPAKGARDAVDAQASPIRARLQADEAALAAARQRLADHAFEYLGKAFDTLDELARHAIGLLPAPEEDKAGRLVLDWNGQCVHAYHNVIEDLRVNRNNARNGYATGGLIEDNRIFVVGQIRHYDGEFRENEIGSRLYVEEYLAGESATRGTDWSSDAYAEGSPMGGPETLALKGGRAINADGFNEAWMHDNVIYGSVDLDLHGHHHSPGFFARESHYHGDLQDHAYMHNAAGECTAHYAQQPGPLGPLGLNETNGILAPEPGCLPHHDHAKRWTSVRFERNLILDPLGYGLRYEDQDHAGDDRIASSESMEELNTPHFHRTHIALADNVVLGSLWVDVFNAEGIELWDDDYSAVRRDAEGIVLDAIEHPLASIVNSHSQRNDGWVDIHDNTVVVIDRAAPVRAGHDPWSAIQVGEAKEMTQLDIAGNAVYVAGEGFDAGVRTAPAFVRTLRVLSGLAPAEAAAVVDAWGGRDVVAGHSHAVLLRTVSDSFVRVCNNAAFGFDVGFEAAYDIMMDVDFEDCGDNDWADALIGWDVMTQQGWQGHAGSLEGLRGASKGTPVERRVDSAADHVEVATG